MKIKILVGFVLLAFITTSCATFMGAEEREKAYGKAVPVITEAFASKEALPGSTWNVYLKASDPDGDMQYVVSVVYQPGWGDYPISRTRIPEDNRKELNGYVYLNTLIPGGYNFLNFFTFTLTVQIMDKAGHYSKPVVFPVTFNYRAIQEPPPPGVFQENPIGPILVNLHPFDVGGGGGDQQ